MLDAPQEEIKSRLNIVEIIAEYLPLKKAGSNFRAVCPFHQEKTPSFMVSEEKQIWHCFGCGQGGDIFTFVEKMEGLEFYDTLKLLAARAGVQLKRDSLGREGTRNSLLFDVLELSAKFYHKLLLDHPKAKIARDYLIKRRINEETIKNFFLGYSPDSWRLLKDFLEKKGFSEETLLAAGLVVQGESKRGFYDRFRNRLMFPLYNPHGQVIGFSARLLDESRDKLGKYINSPQTVLYNKSSVLYGLHLAKESIKRQDSVIIVEGQMDVISSHQNGERQVVASSGTALTVEQIKILKRYTNNIILCFDADSAGQSATERGIRIALAENCPVKYIFLPIGKDPDECIKANPEAWRQAIGQARDIFLYYLDKEFSEEIIKNFPAKKLAVEKLLSFIGLLTSKVSQEHYLQLLAAKSGVGETVLWEELNKVINGYNKGEIKSAAVPREEKQLSENNSEEQFLAILWSNPELLKKYQSRLGDETFRSSILASIYKKLRNHYSDKKDCWTEAEKMKGEELQLVFDNFYGNFGQNKLERELEEIYKRRCHERIFSRLQNLEREIKAAEKNNNQELINKLIGEFNQIKELLAKE